RVKNSRCASCLARLTSSRARAASSCTTAVNWRRNVTDSSSARNAPTDLWRPLHSVETSSLHRLLASQTRTRPRAAPGSRPFSLRRRHQRECGDRAGCLHKKRERCSVEERQRTVDDETTNDRAARGNGEQRPGKELVVVDRDRVGELVALLVAEDTDAQSRARLLTRITAALAHSLQTAKARSVASGRWLAAVFAEEIAPRIPIRDQETLIQHHRGLSGDDLADALERVAVNVTTAVGTVGGALAAVQFTAPPTLLTAPVQLLAETLVVAAVEVKLIGELHEAYGVPASGTPLRRTSSYLASWTQRRALRPGRGVPSLTATMGTAARTALRNRLMRLLGRQMTTLGP